MQNKSHIGRFRRNEAYLGIIKVYSEPCQKATMEDFVKIINGYNYFRKSIIFAILAFKFSTLWNKHQELS